jgi:hypothetical protein
MRVELSRVFILSKRDAVPSSAKPALRHRRVDSPVSVRSRRPTMMGGGIGIVERPCRLPPAAAWFLDRTPDMVHGLASCEDI